MRPTWICGSGTEPGRPPVRSGRSPSSSASRSCVDAEREFVLYERVQGATHPAWAVADRGPCESRRSLELQNSSGFEPQPERDQPYCERSPALLTQTSPPDPFSHAVLVKTVALGEGERKRHLESKDSL